MRLQVDHANTLGAMIDYVGVGPVFDTPTKPDASAACGIDGLGALCARSLHQTVAIGGIQLHNAAAVKRVGPGGIAVVSAICTAVDPQLAARQLHEAS